MRLLKQSTARNVMIFMTDSTDHVSGKTGLTLTITASKDGAAFASITPTVTERVNGWYSLALTSAHTDTLGDLALHVTSAGADPSDVACAVVLDLPGATVTTAASVTALSAAAIQAIWDALTSALTTNNSIGKLLTTNITGDAFVRLGVPAGASHAADIAAVKSVIGAPVGASVSADIAAVKVNVLAIPTTPLLAASYTAPDNASISAIKAKTDNLPGSPADETLVIAATNAIMGRLGAPAGASVSADIAAVETTALAVKAKTDQLGFTGSNVNSIANVVGDKTGYGLAAGQLTVKRNQPLSAFEFLMTDNAAHDPATGLSVTVSRSIDGGAFAATTNSVTEVSNGIYKLDLSAADLNGGVITFRFVATNADIRFVTIVTEA